MNWENNLQIGEYMGCSDIRPATKEQRDLLFQKIKESGYKWENKKERIEKIEHSLALSEEDRSKIQRICKYLNESKKYYADITEVRGCIDWLKSLRQRIGE